MKIALLFSGETRTLNLCAESIKKHVIRDYDVDIFAHVAADPDCHWWSTIWPQSKVQIVQQPEFDEKNYLHRAGRQPVLVQSILRQFWTVYHVNQMKLEAEAQRGKPYDIVLRVRPDSLHHNDLPRFEHLNVDGMDQCCETVYTPRWETHWGINDRLVIGNSAALDAFSSVWPNLDNLMAADAIFHPETLFHQVLVAAGFNIEFIDAWFSTLRLDGQMRRPSFRRDRGDVTADGVRWLPRLPLIKIGADEFRAAT